MSARHRTSVRLEHAGKTVEMQITRQQFQEMTVDLLERTAYTTRELLSAAKMEFTDLSRVLLVGGSTRMPMVIEMIRQMTGLAPDHTVNPDEAVARGAALYAAYLLGKEAEGDARANFQVTNVNAHSLGVEGIDPQTLRKTNVILIPRNMSLPAKATERFVTKTEGQGSIVIQVLEGESSLPGECTAIGRTVVRDLPDGLPKGWPIEVTFEYGSNGRLRVGAVVPGTHHRARLELERAVGLTDERIARWKQPVDSAAGFGAFESTANQVAEAVARGGPAAAAETSAPAPAGSMVSGPLPPRGTPAVPVAQPVGRPAPAATRSGPITRAQPAARPRLRRWVLNLIGYISSAIVGLGAGYLVLHLLRGESFPLPSLPWPW